MRTMRNMRTFVFRFDRPSSSEPEKGREDFLIPLVTTCSMTVGV